MKARIIVNGEFKELIKADLDEEGKQLMVRGKPMPTHIDEFGFPFPCTIDSEGFLVDNADIEFIDYD